jgi:hypothetical protein
MDEMKVSSSWGTEVVVPIWQSRVDLLCEKRRTEGAEQREAICQFVGKQMGPEAERYARKHLLTREERRLALALAVRPARTPEQEERVRRKRAELLRVKIARPADAADWPEAPLPPSTAEGFDLLTYPRGLLGHVVQYIVDTDRFPDRRMALATSLSACAKMLDRKVVGPTGSSTVLWNVTIAETGAGKNHHLNCIRMLLRSVSMETVIAAGGLASVQAIDEILEGHAHIEGNVSPLVLIDEVGSWMTRVLCKSQGGNVSEIPGELCKLYGHTLETERMGTKKVGKEMKPTHGPAFAISGYSTERLYFKAFKQKEVSGGFINRQGLFKAANGGRGWIGPPVTPKYDWTQIPAWLAKALKAVAGPPAITNEQVRLVGSDPAGRQFVLRDLRRLGWTNEVENLWAAYVGETRSMPAAEDREMWIRAPEQALRYAQVHAVFRGATEIGVVDWEWGKALARSNVLQMIAGINEYGEEDLSLGELTQHIRGLLHRKGELTEGAIRKQSERLTHDYRRIDQVLQHLKAVGDIDDEDTIGNVGRRTIRWRWLRRK